MFDPKAWPIRRARTSPGFPWARVAGGLLVLTGGLLGCSSTPDSPYANPTVREIVDGDTISLDFGDRVEVARLLGIDTPESVDPNRPVQCFGREATSALRALLPLGTPVRVERDVDARDRYGRLLVYVFRLADDLFVNLALVNDGFGDLSIYRPNIAYRALLSDALARARTAERGLWAACGGPDVPLDPPSLGSTHTER